MKYAVVFLWALPVISAGQYALVLDDRLDIYRQVVTGIAVEVEEDLQEYSLEGDLGKASQIIAQIMKQKPSVVIAIGPKAAASLKKLSNMPLIFCLVPRVEALHGDQANLTAVRMEAQFKHQLLVAKTLLGEKKRVGVLYHPKDSAQVINNAKNAAQKADLTLVPIAVSDVSLVEKALQDHLPKFDGLWIFYDPVAMSLSGINTILAFAKAHSFPVVTSQEQLVRHGALAAFSMDYLRLGMQVGRLANDLAKSQGHKKGGKIISPEGLRLLVNLQGVRQMPNPAELSLRLATLSATSNYALAFL